MDSTPDFFSYLYRVLHLWVMVQQKHGFLFIREKLAESTPFLHLYHNRQLCICIWTIFKDPVDCFGVKLCVCVYVYVEPIAENTKINETH